MRPAARLTIDFQLVPMFDVGGAVTHLIPSAVDVSGVRAPERERGGTCSGPSRRPGAGRRGWRRRRRGSRPPSTPTTWRAWWVPRPRV